MTESLAYDVVRTSDKVELRRYAPHIVAQVEVNADALDDATRAGFRPLADYIFGNNLPQDEIAMTTPVTTQPAPARSSRPGEKIAMTTPVTSTISGEGTYLVRFSMPSQWTMATLPAPADSRIRLLDVAERLALARRFRGRNDPSRITSGAKELVAAAAALGLTSTGEPFWAGYSAPYVPVPARRWEMLLAVEDADDGRA